jgi:hypothetical protein
MNRIRSLSLVAVVVVLAAFALAAPDAQAAPTHVTTVIHLSGAAPTRT